MREGVEGITSTLLRGTRYTSENVLLSKKNQRYRVPLNFNMFALSLLINKLSFTLKLYLLVVSRPMILKSLKEASGLHDKMWSLTAVEFWPLSGLPDSAEMPKCSLYLLLAWRIDSPTYVELHLQHVYLYIMPEVRYEGMESLNLNRDLSLVEAR